MQIFISHSSKDNEWVELLKKRIEASGTIAYLAQYDYSGVGKSLNDKLQMEIRASDAVVVLLTENTRSAQIVGAEIGYAIAEGKRIVPLVAPEVASDPSALAMLNGVEYIPFDLNDPQEGLLKLTDVVNYLVKLEIEERHQAERTNLSAQVTQLQSNYDTMVTLLIFAASIGAVVLIARSDQ